LATWKRAGSEAECRARSVNQVYGSKDPDPDPYQNVTDPEQWKKCCMQVVFLNGKCRARC
jgi:hypothetical protein